MVALPQMLEEEEEEEEELENEVLSCRARG